MSRIGRQPVDIPQGVDVTVNADEHSITVKGPKGTLTHTFPESITVECKDNQVHVTRHSDDKEHRALHGLTRALIHDMVIGVTQGYEKHLEINGVGYRAAKEGKNLNLSLGYSHPVIVPDPEGIETEVKDQVNIIVRGIDKEKVGQHAANIRFKRPPEPYKGKGIKYDYEHIRRKVGKTGK